MTEYRRRLRPGAARRTALAPADHRAAAAIAVVLTACSVSPPPDTPDILAESLPSTTEVPTDFVAAEAVDAGDVDDGWIDDFGDERLTALVDEALANSLDLRAAAAQVDRAAGLARLAGAALEPSVSLAADLSQTAGDRAVEGTSYGAGLAVSWEADVWGRVRAGARAGDEALAASVADYEFARQSLAASVAKTWFLATELGLQVSLANQTVEIFSQLLELAEARHELGRVPMQDVHLARADVASAEEALRQAESGRQQTTRALEVLIGRYPSAELEAATDLAAVPPPIPVGLPSQLVERRADLLAAERRVRSAFYASEEARLARLPRFGLNATVGGSDELGSVIGNLAGGVFAPLFQGGAIAAQIDTATADQEASIAAYGKAALAAFEEVENALSNEKLFAERQTYLETVVTENEQAYELVKTQYEVGQVDLLSVLQVQARVVAARVGLLRIRDERLAQRVNLHLALGGSFASADAAGP
jgi:NodT family efflux transporter outer membrane factor (OMF) lipoprotein